MNKLKSIFMMFLVFVILFLSIMPMMFVSTYVFTGCSKETFISTMQLIPESRFWMIGIPIFAMCYICTIYLLWKFFKLGTSHPVEFKFAGKKVYHLEDADLAEKLSILITDSQMSTDETIPKKMDDEIKVFTDDIKNFPDNIKTFGDNVKTFGNNVKTFGNSLRKTSANVKIKSADMKKKSGNIVRKIKSSL